MRNFIPLAAMLGVGLLTSTLAAQTRPEPVLYDLVIDGESFTVEINRSLKVQSKKKPGVSYEIALRVAPSQRLLLNRLQFDYDRGYEVTDDVGKNVRTATLNHELGYTMVVSDVGAFG